MIFLKIIGAILLFWIIINIIQTFLDTNLLDWSFRKKWRYYLFCLVVPFGALAKDEEEIKEFIYIYFGDDDYY